MSVERIQKVLARAGVASRRGAEELIRAGRVTVNGRSATLGERVDGERDAIKVDGKRVRPPRHHRYYLVNKPRGYVSTRADPEGRRTVMDLVPAKDRARLFPVGRLDYQSEGLLLLTDDGDLAQRVTHPRFGCVKRYSVKVKGVPEESALERLRRGVRLAGRPTGPARIRPLKVPGVRPGRSNSWWTVELGEGRTRQIREMFFLIGHPVQRLRRVAIGTLGDSRLPPGACRELTAAEVRKLGGSSGRQRAANRRRRGRHGRA